MNFLCVVHFQFIFQILKDGDTSVSCHIPNVLSWKNEMGGHCDKTSLSYFQDISITNDENGNEEVPQRKKYKLDLESMIEKLRNVTGKGALEDMVTAFEHQLLVKERLVCLINKREKNFQKQQTEYAEKLDQLSKVKASKELISDE